MREGQKNTRKTLGAALVAGSIAIAGSTAHGAGIFDADYYLNGTQANIQTGDEGEGHNFKLDHFNDSSYSEGKDSNDIEVINFTVTDDSALFSRVVDGNTFNFICDARPENSTSDVDIYMFSDLVPSSGAWDEYLQIAFGDNQPSDGTFDNKPMYFHVFDGEANPTGDFYNVRDVIGGSGRIDLAGLKADYAAGSMRKVGELRFDIPDSIPEPSTLGLAGLAGLAAGAITGRRRHMSKKDARQHGV
ncbi:MAG: PEP-CTERM sorting domain-containing protein [Kiritimatiellales bacterium]|nr:PEP-CTERM sorting domain-containing protein [Kiritimatiellales bacterium]